jgi:hypothetical protein
VLMRRAYLGSGIAVVASALAVVVAAVSTTV